MLMQAHRGVEGTALNNRKPVLEGGG